MTGRIHSLESFGAADGPGIRFVVFFQGCPLRCLYCHNPDSWEPSAGTEMTAGEIIEKVVAYKDFYRNGGGVTLSGGEPLLQHEFAYELLLELKKQGIHTAIDTSGCIPLHLCQKAIDLADMLLLDIKTFDPSLCRTLTGNGDVLRREKELLGYCELQKKPVWIRHVIVPGLTLADEKLAELGSYLRGFRCVQKIQPLPFHKLGEYKWNSELYQLKDTLPPTEEEMRQAIRILR